MRRWFVWLSITGLGLLGLFFLDRYYRTQVDLDNEQDLIYVAENTSVELTHAFQLNMEAVESLKAFMLADSSLPDFTIIDNFIAALIPNYPPIRTLQYVDTDLIIQYTYPLEGNESAIGIDLATHPTAPFVQKAIEEHRLTVTNPFITAQGSLAIVARTPLYRDGEFYGLAAGVFDIEPIINGSIRRLNSKYAMQLRDNTDNVFWGSETLSGDIHHIAFPVGDTFWTLAMSTTPQYADVFVLSLIWIGGSALLLSGMFVLSRAARSFQRTLRARDQLQTAVQHSNQQLRMAVHAANIGLWDWDLQTKEIYFSPEWKQQIGYEDHEIPNDFSEWEQRVHPDDLDTTLRTIEAYVANPYPNYQLEFRFRHKDGTYRWILAHGDMVYDAQGKPVRMMGSHIDITARKQVEVRLHESEQRFSRIFEVSPVATVLTQAKDTQFVNVNEAMEVLTGYSRDELLGRTSLELDLFVSPEVRSQLAQRSSHTRAYKNVAMQLRQKSGDIREIVLSSDIMELHGEQYAITMAHDVTERRLAEKTLESSEKHFRTLIEKSSDIILLIRADGSTKYVSPSIESLLGYSPQAFMQLQRQDILHPDEREELASQLKWIIDHPGEAIEGEHRVRHQDGSWRTFHRTIRNLLQDPAVNAVIANLHDVTMQKQAEEALRESEARFRTLVEHASDGIFVADSNGYYIDVNTGGCSMLGYPREELIGLHLRDLIPSDNLAVQPLKVDQLKDGKAIITERMLKRKDGSSIPVEMSAKMLPNGNLLGIARDITERTQAQQALREREERFRLAMENIPDVVVIYDRDLRIQFINNATTALTGRPPSDFIGRHEEEIWQPEVYETYLPTLKEAFETKSTRTAEINLTLQNDQSRFLAITCVPILNQQGDVQEILGITRDYTESKQAQAALHRFNQRLTILHEIDRNIINSRSIETITQVVLKGLRQLIACPRASVTLFDDDASEAIIFAKNSEDISNIQPSMRIPIVHNQLFEVLQSGKILLVGDLHKLDNPFSKTIMEPTIKEGIRSSVTVPLMVQGQLIGSLNLAAKMPDFFTIEHQEIIQEVATQLAISIHQSRLREQIEQTNIELEQRVAERTHQLEANNRELETFTYTVSHDLKAPLRGIDGYSRLLMADYLDQLGDEGRSFLQNIRTATDQMNQLIDDLLSYSRLERRLQQYVELSVKRLVDSLVTERTADILQSQASVTVTLPDARISVDPNGLTMALRNLLDNALKFTRPEEKPVIEIGGQENEDSYILWVQDNGIGFDMKYHDRILQIFQRLHRAEQYQGTGIGLAIVQKAMERLKGRVWAESELGKGSTFYLEVPK